MKKITSRFQAIGLLLALFSLSILAVEATATEEPYGIQPGDVLEISVWREEGLTKAVLVLPDGGISFPLVGTLNAAGKTVMEVESLVTERLTKFIPDPVVSVSMQNLSGNAIYVIGKVAKPGAIPANRYMDVVQALSVAGGMTPYAASNKIKILRRSNGMMTSTPFRYGDIEKGENLDQNIILQSGDVVLVP